jgi:hypothetical protein
MGKVKDWYQEILEEEQSNNPEQEGNDERSERTS